MSAKRIRVTDVELHVVDEGNGPPVLLLHGFPDSSHLWRNQIPALVNVGLRAIAPDLRGFGESDKPADVEAYALPVILQEVVGLLDRLGTERVHIVAHDWGAAVGWLLASLHPDRVDRLVALSVGNPNAFFKSGIDQREKSWYMLLFQFRGVAEQLLMRNDWQLCRDLVRHHSEIGKWIADLSRPGALSAALNWYRANAGPEVFLTDRMPLPNVQAPTLGVWSSGDAYLTEAQMVRSSESVSGSWHYERLEGASHWMQLDRPQEMNRLLVDFLAGKSR
ncbi:MAG: alpha/beta hydrolase [Betaproteobacteria bacterium]|nr:MAG: alpha/beta hydrolase [Betaproteobacteria bacterium]